MTKEREEARREDSKEIHEKGRRRLKLIRGKGSKNS